MLLFLVRLLSIIRRLTFASFTSFTSLKDYTVLKLEIYRMILAPLFCNSILNLIFAFICFSNMGARLEYALGSAQFLALMGTISLLANLGFVTFCFFMAMFGTYEALFFQCQGFWVVLMGLIVVECMSSNEPTRQLFFIPYQIPTKYFPLALYALFTLFGGLNLGMAISMGIGYLYSLGHLDVFKPTVLVVQSWEQGCLANFTTRPHYVTQGLAQGAGAWAINSTSGSGDWGQRASSSQQYDAESGSGGRGFWPQGPPPSAPQLSSAGSEKDSFPGGGQSVGGRDVSGAAAHDPAAARAARLAALERRSSVGGNSPKNVGGSGASFMWPSELAKLEAMGYATADAKAALSNSDGNLTVAVGMLTD